MSAGTFGNRVNKGGSSGPSNGGTPHEARMYMTPSLYKIAKSLPPTERVRLIEKKPAKIAGDAMTDDQIMEMIRQNKSGISYKLLAEQTGKNISWVRAICQGLNRGHLLRMVEEGYKDFRMGWKHDKSSNTYFFCDSPIKGTGKKELVLSKFPDANCEMGKDESGHRTWTVNCNGDSFTSYKAAVSWGMAYEAITK